MFVVRLQATVLIFLALIFVAGCRDTATSAYRILESEDDLAVIIVNGTEIDFGDGYLYRVFGSDRCDSLKGEPGGGEKFGCAILTGRRSLELTMISPQQRSHRQMFTLLEVRDEQGRLNRIRMAKGDGAELRPVIIGKDRVRGGYCVVGQTPECVMQ